MYSHAHQDFAFVFLMQLRVEEGLPAKLISYSRADTAGPKLSNFFIALIDVSQSVKLL